MESSAPKSDVNLLAMAVVVEGGLVLLALGLAWFGFFSQEQPLEALRHESSAEWVRILIWGAIATIPMLVYLVVFHFWTPGFYRPMQQIIDTKLRPMFQGSSLLELLILSLMAGFCEELFFRWCLQGGMTTVLTSHIGLTGAIIFGVAVASVVFGGCHWVNASYGITSLLVGAYLGVLMIWTSSWLVPAIAHALFDFVAMIYIARWPAKKGKLQSQI